MGKFKKGFLLGSLLGAGMVWLNTTQRGKQVRAKMLDYASDVYEDVREQIISSDAWQKMSKHKYVEMVQKAVDRYVVENGLAANMKTMLVNLVVSQWGAMQKEIKKKRRK